MFTVALFIAKSWKKKHNKQKILVKQKTNMQQRKSVQPSSLEKLTKFKIPNNIEQEKREAKNYRY